ncbi:MAG: tRNA pseudouridine(38-40) synthase TruA [Candidatus Dependentiae bacterium]|nr:tRNA pseudouridine(38-40) synthase TruA [Candidatus Dependentiae bacterium]
MAVYKMVVAYDGTAYHGWQRQPDAITVVQVLEETFKSVFKQKISISGASRTDAGVHALGQVAAFTLDMKIAPEILKFAWNNVLPLDILIHDISIVSDNFNPRHGVISKTYHYVFFNKRPTPFTQRYGWYFSRPVDLDLLQEALQIFVGTHDFRSFCTGYDMHSTVRTIHSIHVEYDDAAKTYKIVVKGPGFLRYMIRRIVGACLAVASKDQFSCEDIRIALAKKDPAQTLPNSPAKGLLLYEIQYE